MSHVAGIRSSIRLGTDIRIRGCCNRQSSLRAKCCRRARQRRVLMDVSASQVTDLVLWWVRLACEMLGKVVSDD